MALSGHGAVVAADVSQEIVQRANTLYWNSGDSVNRLAQDLDLSKGALYELISPLPAGIPCPMGDGELTYANRTARARGFVSCPSCGLEEEEDRVMERLERGGQVSEMELQKALPPADPGRQFSGHLLVGSAFLGAAAGFVLANLLKRR